MGAEGIVSDFVAQMQYEVDENSTCIQTCPMQQEAWYNLTVNPLATDKGPASLDGKTYEHFYWMDTILKKVPMDTVDAYVNITDPANPIPYLWVEYLEPFGQFLAEANTTYHGFQGGPQDPNLFVVYKAQGCPVDPQCASD